MHLNTHFNLSNSVYVNHPVNSQQWLSEQY